MLEIVVRENGIGFFSDGIDFAHEEWLIHHHVTLYANNITMVFMACKGGAYTKAGIKTFYHPKSHFDPVSYGKEHTGNCKYFLTTKMKTEYIAFS